MNNDIPTWARNRRKRPFVPTVLLVVMAIDVALVLWIALRY